MMTGEELYEFFKDSLNYLGVGFGGMSQVTVTIKGSDLIISVDGRKCAMSIPLEEVK